jgi:two-component sensor histidine kinase
MSGARRAAALSPEKRGSLFLIVFFAILVLLLALVFATYAGSKRLSEMTDRQDEFFDRNFSEQSSSLNRVIFAVGEALVFAASPHEGRDFPKALEVGQATVNQARIPDIIDSSLLATFLEDDPLYLAERLGASNERYSKAIVGLSGLLDEARAKGDSREGWDVLERFFAAEDAFKELLRERSGLFIQLEGMYYAANRKGLDSLRSRLNANITLFSLLAALLALVSVLFLRSRLAIERELKAHRERLEELVATRTSELGAANERLTSALADREVLIKEIYHRVKNNLTMVAGLIALQQAQARPENLDQAFDGLSQRVYAIANLHEKLYRSADLVHIDFGDYVGELCSALLSSLAADPGRFSLEVQASSASFPAATMIPLGLIVNELVTNSLKHAFPDGRPGRIRVSLEEGEGGLVLQVGDDGLPPTDARAILESQSLGLTIVKSLVRQLGGSLRIDLSGGTTTLITLPRALTGA